MNLHKIWIEQCEAARGIEDEFGTQKALDYLIGEKFINYLEAAEGQPEWTAEIPTFVVEIKSIFETWQLGQYLEIAHQTEPFDPSIYDDPKTPRWNDSQSFGSRPLNCCWLSGPGNGCWKNELASRKVTRCKPTKKGATTNTPALHAPSAVAN